MKAGIKSALVVLALSGCGQMMPIEIEREGYVMQSLSVNASHQSVGFTVTFANLKLPEGGNTCVGVEVCNEVME